MRRLDELFTARPFLGSRRMTAMLRAEGRPINRKRVQRLMRQMGIAALGPKPRTTQAGAGPQDLSRICCATWRSTGRTRCGRPTSPTSRSARGFLYLVAIIDWASRAVLAWRLSNTHGRVVLRRGARGGAGALRQAGDLQHRPGQPVHQRGLHRHGSTAAGIRISMDGRGRWMDNVFIERLWRSLKYEDVYLKGYADGREARAGIAAWIAFYNSRRPHQALGNRTPMAVWRAGVTGALPGKAVDMTLRLDDAGALPTCPQRQQQQQQSILVA